MIVSSRFKIQNAMSFTKGKSYMKGSLKKGKNQKESCRFSTSLFLMKIRISKFHS